MLASIRVLGFGFWDLGVWRKKEREIQTKLYNIIIISIKVVDLWGREAERVEKLKKSLTIDKDNLGII